MTYLQNVVQETSAPASLGWAWLGLRAWDIRPDSKAGAHLAAATDRALARNAGAVELALLVLAAADRSLEVLGLTSRGESEPRQ